MTVQRIVRFCKHHAASQASLRASVRACHSSPKNHAQELNLTSPDCAVRQVTRLARMCCRYTIVVLTLTVPAMILGETSLSFLGLGLRPPVVSWGVMLQDCMNMEVVANYPWLLLPLTFIIVTVLSFNFVGDGMRDAADPYSVR